MGLKILSCLDYLDDTNVLEDVRLQNEYSVNPSA